MSAKLLTGILIGAAAGAVLGVLYAPEKGTDTRRRLSEKGGEWGDTVKNKFNELGEAISEKYDSIRGEATDMLNKGKDAAQNAQNTANNATNDTKRSFA